MIGFQTEFNWLRKQAETQAGQNVRVDYLQISAMLRLNLGSSSPNGFAFYGVAGPGIEIKLADEIEGFTLVDGFEGADVSLLFGGGFEVARIISRAGTRRGCAASTTRSAISRRSRSSRSRSSSGCDSNNT